MSKKLLSNYSGGSIKKKNHRKDISFLLKGTNILKRVDALPVVRTEITKVSGS